MTLIDLPNGSKWDEAKTFDQQEQEAQAYYQSVLDEDNMITDDEEEVGKAGSGKSRWMKQHIDDTDNSLRIIRTRVYRGKTTDPDCGAVKLHGGNIEMIT